MTYVLYGLDCAAVPQMASWVWFQKWGNPFYNGHRHLCYMSNSIAEMNMFTKHNNSCTDCWVAASLFWLTTLRCFTGVLFYFSWKPVTFCASYLTVTFHTSSKHPPPLHLPDSSSAWHLHCSSLPLPSLNHIKLLSKVLGVPVST